MGTEKKRVGEGIVKGEFLEKRTSKIQIYAKFICIQILLTEIQSL